MNLLGRMPKTLFRTSLFLFAFLFAVTHAIALEKAPATKENGPQSVKLGDSGDKIRINENYYFTWEFDKKPSMGPLVLKIKLYTADGTRSTALLLKGSSDMPSMRGAHYTGDHPFKVSKKGDYLLPVDVVMPGDWEVQIIIFSGETVIFRGHVDFDV